jgi:hypothetical protein
VQTAKELERMIDKPESSSGVFRPAMLCVLSVAGAYILADLIEVNRFAHLWMHGASFFRYQCVFLVLFGSGLTIYAIQRRGPRRLGTLELAFVCTVGAFLCAVLALFILPAFSGRDLFRNLTSVLGLRTLVVGAGLTLSWVTGILTGVLAGTLLQGKRRAVVILGAACILIRVSEVIAHYRLGERIW